MSNTLMGLKLKVSKTGGWVQIYIFKKSDFLCGMGAGSYIESMGLLGDEYSIFIVAISLWQAGYSHYTHTHVPCNLIDHDDGENSGTASTQNTNHLSS